MNDSQTVIKNIFEELKEVRNVVGDKDYKRMLATVSVANFVVESVEAGEEFTRKDIHNHVGKVLESEGFENYTYGFYRRWDV
ncbi:hypothetical protein QNK01_11615 (plasmid) [Desemzia incerta]|uniref:hypothetical protein n=1 Tax=Desemzia incerta TaxID=82801 RepID=UPI0024C3F4F4|nr:hypothetical protein [Desemzia incerta]WHZ33217.1 hypothetical protein QNK01_11615 [Desemzia incerta]